MAVPSESLSLDGGPSDGYLVLGLVTAERVAIWPGVPALRLEFRLGSSVEVQRVTVTPASLRHYGKAPGKFGVYSAAAEPRRSGPAAGLRYDGPSGRRAGCRSPVAKGQCFSNRILRAGAQTREERRAETQPEKPHEWKTAASIFIAELPLRDFSGFDC